MTRLLFLLLFMYCSDDVVKNELVDSIKNIFVQIDRTNNELYIQVETNPDISVSQIDSVKVNLKYVGGIGLEYEYEFLLYDNGQNGDIIPDNGIYSLVDQASKVDVPDEQAEIVSVNFPVYFELDDTEFSIIPFTITIRGKKYLATVSLFENNTLHTLEKYINIDNTYLEIQNNKQGLYIDDVNTEVCDRIADTYGDIFYPIPFDWPDATSTLINNYFIYESAFRVESMQDCASTGSSIFKFILNDLDTNESVSKEKSIVIFGCGDGICEQDYENNNSCSGDCSDE